MTGLQKTILTGGFLLLLAGLGLMVYDRLENPGEPESLLSFLRGDGKARPAHEKRKPQERKTPPAPEKKPETTAPPVEETPEVPEEKPHEEKPEPEEKPEVRSGKSEKPVEPEVVPEKPEVVTPPAKSQEEIRKKREIRDAYASIREAEEYLRQNSKESAREAMVLFNKVLSRDLTQELNQLSRFGLGVALERMGERSAALDHYRYLKEEGVTDRELARRLDFRLGKVLLEINHVEEGRALLDSLLAKGVDPLLISDIHTALGNHYLGQGQMDEAKNRFNVALKYNPNNLQAELGRAHAANGQGNFRQAYEYYDEYLLGDANLDPDHRAELLERLRKSAYEDGIEAYKKGRFEDAVFHFRKVIFSYPDEDINERASFWLGESYAALGQEDMALAMYDRVLGNGNEAMDQAALLKKGILHFQRGRLDEALIAFHRATEDFPTGEYSKKAREWEEEIRAQIRERDMFKSMDSRSGYGRP